MLDAVCLMRTKYYKFKYRSSNSKLLQTVHGKIILVQSPWRPVQKTNLPNCKNSKIIGLINQVIINQTRIHSSRMRTTALNRTVVGGLADRDPPGQRPHWTETPLDRDPPGRRSPCTVTPRTEIPGQRPPGQRSPIQRFPPGQTPSWTETSLSPCEQNHRQV